MAENPNRGTHEVNEAHLRNQALTIIIVSIVPMLLISSLILYQFHRSYSEKAYAHLETLVKKHKQNIDSFLKEKLGDIRFLTRTFSYEELKDESFLQDRLQTLQKEFDNVFVDLGVINYQGMQVAYAGPFKLGRALYADADWFQASMKQKAVISDVFLGLRGLPHFIIAVRENHNGEDWLLRSTIDFVTFNDLVENIRIGKTGCAFILNRHGELQTQSPSDMSPGEIHLKSLLERHGQNNAKGPVHISKQEEDNGKEYIYVSAFLKDGDWLLVFRQSTDDAFADFHRTVRVTIAILLMGILAIVSTSILVSRHMSHRFAEVDKEREMMNEQIVETGKLASVGELAAGIAHEINNPVAIMVEEAGWIEDLLMEEEFQEGENLEEFHRALQQIRTQGLRCKEITHKLLSFARKTESRAKHFQLNRVLEELVNLSEQRAKYSKVVIETSLQQDLPLIQASETEVQQVFLNLINNAIDAMEKDGGNLFIRTRLKDGFAQVDVVDTGPGIPQSNLGRIFDPFFTTKPVGKGTGLGLSICYGIVKKMGGDIQVESRMGSGTEFRVTLPIAVAGVDPGDPPQQGS
jgi:two-component system NtrC family sensor kinase